jgi:fumarate reductase subunit C
MPSEGGPLLQAGVASLPPASPILILVNVITHVSTLFRGLRNFRVTHVMIHVGQRKVTHEPGDQVPSLPRH